jgi:hypothetical protein
VTGYWSSDWPGEDGGASRRQTSLASGLGARTGELRATARDALGATMAVQRDRGELFVQGATIGPDSTAWIERIDPVSLDPVVRVDDLPAGPWWPGGVLVHANGDLYLTQGRWCHRLTSQLDLVSSRELPRDRPYNSLVALDDGSLVMKDMSNDDAEPSQLVVLDPDDLAIRHLHDLDEGSIARLSADGTHVCVVGMQSLIALQVEGARVTEVGRSRYRTVEGQTFGWDAVLDGRGSAWFLDNGEGTEAFGGCFHGKTSSSAPLHLVRASWPPRGEDAELFEIMGEPGGIVANPPIIAVDDDGGIAVGYDSGHGVMAAWRWSTGHSQLEPLWTRTQDHASHSIHFRDTGELVTFDYDMARGMDQCVVLDIATGDELGRVDTGSPLQSVVFPCPGWSNDCYTLTFSTLTRVFTA